MVIVLVIGFIWNRGGSGLRRQVLGIVLPAVLIGGYLIAMRVMAPESPGALTAVGYFVNHPQAEDNAKWLHLAAQLADGRALEFNGYAGGPLLLVMSMVAALISVLSMVLLGGVNQVAVATNTVIGTQFLLIALVPFALAPFVERRVSLRGARRRWVPWPAIGAAMLALFVASSVITSFGHLSLQFVLLVLVLWSLVFLLRVPGQARLLMTLVVVCTASVWVPFNVLGLALLIVACAWTIRARNWWGLAAVVATLAAVWDALISSLLFLLGIQINLGAEGESSASDSSAGGVSETVAGNSVQSSLYDQVETAKSLFTAPGGVEQIQPLVAGLALASVVFAVWLVARTDVGRLRSLVPFAPLVVVGGYLVAIEVGDAIATGGAPHYGGHKLAFAFTIMALVSTLPIAITGIDLSVRGMTAARWFAVGGVVLALTVDTMLPRALSALSPMLWPAVDASAPAYWASAEVKPLADQPISSLPIACVFAPPVSDLPTALPLGQQSYNCTRLLLGLNGLEGEPTELVNWLQRDWMSNTSNWEDFYTRLEGVAVEHGNRTVLLMNPEGGTSGLTTLGSLLQQYAPATG